MLNVANAQITFQKTIGSQYDDIGYSITQTSDGGYIVAGQQSTSAQQTSWDAFLVKLNPTGDTTWTKSYGGIFWEHFQSVIQTTDGGYAMSGVTNSFGTNPAGDVFVVKVNSNGDSLWSKSIGSSNNLDIGYQIGLTSDGGFIIAASQGFNGADGHLIKLDSLGTTSWTTTLNINYNNVYSVQQTTDGGYILVGEQITGGISDMLLIKTDVSGNVIGTVSYGGTSQDVAYCVYQTTDGGYIICGKTYSFGAGGFDIYIIKTDANSDTIWTKAYGGTADDIGYYIEQTADGGYITVGESKSFGGGFGNSNLYLLKTDSVGDLEWSKSFGGFQADIGYEVHQTTDGGYIIVGESQSFGAGSSDVYVIKTDSFGNSDGCFSGSDASIITSPTSTSVGFVSINATNWIVNTESPILSINRPEVKEYDMQLTTVLAPVDKTDCSINDGSINLTVLGGITPYSFSWSNGATSPNNSGLYTGTHVVTITDSIGCSVQDSVAIGSGLIPPEPICMVTVDSTSTKNLIVWEKPITSVIDSFKIYRDLIGVFTHIGSVPYQDLSEFTDTTNGINPQTTSYRYKISVLDTCGNESTLSDHHKTIHLQNSLGTPPAINLLWDSYEGFTFTFYRILRDSTGFGNWEVIDSVGSGIFTWTDQDPPTNPRYLVEVIPPDTCTADKGKNFNSSKSNTSTSDTTTGVLSLGSENNISIFPNPTNGILFVRFNSQFIRPYEIRITDVLGQLAIIKEGVSYSGTGSIKVDCTGLAPGIYLLQYTDTHTQIKKKLIIE